MPEIGRELNRTKLCLVVAIPVALLVGVYIFEDAAERYDVVVGVIFGLVSGIFSGLFWSGVALAVAAILQAAAPHPR
jgi:hypothetical protein